MIKQIQELEIEVIRKNVKNINLTVLPPDGHLRVSVPFGLSEERLAEFLCSKTDWIRVHRQKVIERAAKKEAGSALRNPEMSEEERKELLERYREFLRPKLEEYLAFWGRQTGLHPEKWQMRDMKTRWGSCTSEGNLNFNWRLIFAPEKILDYVVVHELSHRKEMNHSPAFYAVVASVMPEYKACEKWLRDNGATLWQNPSP